MRLRTKVGLGLSGLALLTLVGCGNSLTPKQIEVAKAKITEEIEASAQYIAEKTRADGAEKDVADLTKKLGESGEEVVNLTRDVGDAKKGLESANILYGKLENHNRALKGKAETADVAVKGYESQVKELEGENTRLKKELEKKPGYLIPFGDGLYFGVKGEETIKFMNDAIGLVERARAKRLDRYHVLSPQDRELAYTDADRLGNVPKEIGNGYVTLEQAKLFYKKVRTAYEGIKRRLLVNKKGPVEKYFEPFEEKNAQDPATPANGGAEEIQNQANPAQGNVQPESD